MTPKEQIENLVATWFGDPAKWESKQILGKVELCGFAEYVAESVMPQWISVDGGLPKCNFDEYGVSVERFPVWCKKRGYLASKIRKSTTQEKEVVFYFEDCLGYIPNITHYQSLPEPPQQ